jgi:zinc protease
MTPAPSAALRAGLRIGERWALALGVVILLGKPLAADDVSRFTAPNGLRVLVKPVPATEVVAVELLMNISALDEPPGKAGIRELLLRLMLRGAGVRSAGVPGGPPEGWQSAPPRLAEFGGTLSGSVGLDYVELCALAPADGLEAAVDALGEAIRGPARLAGSEQRFLPDDVREEKQDLLAAIRATDEDAFQTAYSAFRQVLYRGHPYGTPTTGDADSVASITVDDLTGFRATYYRPNAAVLAICGGVTPERAMRAARSVLGGGLDASGTERRAKVFGGWEPGPRQERPRALLELLPSSSVAVREGRFGQAYMMLGFPAPAVDQPGYYALQVVDSLLAGTSGSLLPKALREEAGLAYDVSSFYPTLAQTSHLVVCVATEPQRLEAAKSAILAVLRKLSQEPVPADDLERAKRSLLGSYALGRQRMKEQAYALAWYETLGLAPDFGERYLASIQAVGPGDVQEAAKAVFGRFVAAVALPAR